jgi:hypothetical protein
VEYAPSATGYAAAHRRYLVTRRNAPQQKELTLRRESKFKNPRSGQRKGGQETPGQQNQDPNRRGGGGVVQGLVMATERQLELEQSFRSALKALGPGASAEFLIAAVSEQTAAPREIIEAVEIVNRPDGRAAELDEEVTSLVRALGKSVTVLECSPRSPALRPAV